MVGTLKRAISKYTCSNPGEDWDECIGNIMLFYRAIKKRYNKSSFSLMLRNFCCLITIPAPSGEEEVSVAELGTRDLSRAHGVRVGQEHSVGTVRNVAEIWEGVQVFVPTDRILQPLEPMWMHPFVVVKARHPSYGLRRTDGKESRSLVHASCLRVYQHRHCISINASVVESGGPFSGPRVHLSV